MNLTSRDTVQEETYSFIFSKTLLLFIKGCISIGLLIYLFQKIGLHEFFHIFYNIPPRLFLFSGLLYMGCQYLSAYRWQVLLRAHDVFVSVNRLFSFYLVGMFFNNFLPTSIGGDVIKGFDLYRHSGKGKESITTVFLERYTGLVAIIIIGLTALAIGHPYLPDPVITIFMVAIATGFAGGTLIVTNYHMKALCLRISQKFKMGKVDKSILGLYETFRRYRSNKRAFLYAVFLSFCIQLLNILVYILLADSLGINAHWGYFFLFFPIVTVISMLPISFNGLGMREGLFIYLFSKIEIPSAQAFSLSLSWFFIVTCISLLGGLIFMVRKKV